ncbi:DNA-protecting protein DprA [Candidatus Uhrbacteria bacterium]|nr:DNA-protecting protein DprA [Candidatus Uhrbacteria bacterium]
MPDVRAHDNIRTITRDDPDYPALLLKTYDPPKELYIRGTLPPADSIYFAVVGTRLMSPYGKQVTHEIVNELARAGVVIVSGLALGIDGEAHRAALETRGRTIAVLGSGIDDASVYPSEHRGLSDQIVESSGAVIAEYPPETSPTKYSFPQRNRIIAGMSVGVLVIEAKEKSGALITAQFALDEGREVFAVPGHVTRETSYGPHMLIRAGATLVTRARDILEELGVTEAPHPTLPTLDGPEAEIFAALGREPIHIDALAATTKLDIAALTSTLAILEVKGLVKNIGGMHFIRIV